MEYSKIQRFKKSRNQIVQTVASTSPDHNLLVYLEDRGGIVEINNRNQKERRRKIKKEKKEKRKRKENQMKPDTKKLKPRDYSCLSDYSTLLHPTPIAHSDPIVHRLSSIVPPLPSSASASGLHPLSATPSACSFSSLPRLLMACYRLGRDGLSCILTASPLMGFDVFCLLLFSVFLHYIYDIFIILNIPSICYITNYDVSPCSRGSHARPFSRPAMANRQAAGRPDPIPPTPTPTPAEFTASQIQHVQQPDMLQCRRQPRDCTGHPGAIHRRRFCQDVVYLCLVCLVGLVGLAQPHSTATQGHPGAAPVPGIVGRPYPTRPRHGPAQPPRPPTLLLCISAPAVP